MTNSIYDSARYRFGKALLDWSTAPLFLLAYSGTPVFYPEDTAVSDITARAETLMVSQSQAIAGKNVTLQGFLQTGPVVFEEVPIGPPITHFIMVSQSALLPAAIPLLYIDVAENMPYVPNGLDIVVTPDWLEQRGWGRL
jgi:hypothetical protein